MPKNTLYVTGFTRESKAVDLAPEFEKYGDLVRLDIPPPRTSDGQKFAFVEYKDAEGCERALDMDGKEFPFTLPEGLVVQVAKSDPFPSRERGGFRGRGGYGYGGGGPGYGRGGGYGRGREGYGGGYGGGGYGGGRGYGDGYGRGYGGYGGDRRGGFGDRRGGYGGYGGGRGYDDGYGRRGGGFSGRGGRGGYGDYRGSRDGSREPHDGFRGGPERGFGSSGGGRFEDREYRGGSDRYEREPRAEERGRYSRSPSRSPVRRDRSRSPGF